MEGDDDIVTIRRLVDGDLNVREVRISCPDATGLGVDLTRVLLDFGLRILRSDVSTDGKWCLLIFVVQLASGVPPRWRLLASRLEAMCPQGTESLRLLTAWREAPRDATPFLLQVASYDRSGMLHALTHVLWESDCTVFKAHITTSPDGEVADMFWLVDNRGELPERHRALEICDRVRAGLGGEAECALGMAPKDSLGGAAAGGGHNAGLLGPHSAGGKAADAHHAHAHAHERANASAGGRQSRARQHGNAQAVAQPATSAHAVPQPQRHASSSAVPTSARAAEAAQDAPPAARARSAPHGASSHASTATPQLRRACKDAASSRNLRSIVRDRALRRAASRSAAAAARAASADAALGDGAALAARWSANGSSRGGGVGDVGGVSGAGAGAELGIGVEEGPPPEPAAGRSASGSGLSGLHPPALVSAFASSLAPSPASFSPPGPSSTCGGTSGVASPLGSASSSSSSSAGGGAGEGDWGSDEEPEELCRVSVELEASTTSQYARLALRCPDRKGLLYDVFVALKEVGVRVAYGRCEVLPTGVPDPDLHGDAPGTASRDANEYTNARAGGAGAAYASPHSYGVGAGYPSASASASASAPGSSHGAVGQAPGARPSSPLAPLGLLPFAPPPLTALPPSGAFLPPARGLALPPLATPHAHLDPSSLVYTAGGGTPRGSRHGRKSHHGRTLSALAGGGGTVSAPTSPWNSPRPPLQRVAGADAPRGAEARAGAPHASALGPAGACLLAAHRPPASAPASPARPDDPKKQRPLRGAAGAAGGAPGTLSPSDSEALSAVQAMNALNGFTSGGANVPSATLNAFRPDRAEGGRAAGRSGARLASPPPPPPAPSACSAPPPPKAAAPPPSPPPSPLCDMELFVAEADGSRIVPDELGRELVARVRRAAALPVMVSVRSVFGGCCTELSVTAQLDAGGRGRPRVTFDVTQALSAARVGVFMADVFAAPPDSDEALRVLEGADEDDDEDDEDDDFDGQGARQSQRPQPRWWRAWEDPEGPELEIHRFLVHLPDGSPLSSRRDRDAIRDVVRSQLLGVRPARHVPNGLPATGAGAGGGAPVLVASSSAALASARLSSSATATVHDPLRGSPSSLPRAPSARPTVSQGSESASSVASAAEARAGGVSPPPGGPGSTPGALAAQRLAASPGRGGLTSKEAELLRALSERWKTGWLET